MSANSPPAAASSGPGVSARGPPKDKDDSGRRSAGTLSVSSVESDDSYSESSSSQFSPTRRFIDSRVAAGAPTPFNTVFDEYAYGEDATPEESLVPTGGDRDIAQDVSTKNEGVLPISSALSPTDTRDSRHTTFSTSTDYIPVSTRPIPKPPQLRTVPMDDTLSPIQSLSVDSRAGSRAGKEDETGRRFTNRFRRRKITQTDRDTHRLQQLGYDAVLGRDYNFWSSVSIGWMNIGTIQGTVFAVAGAYKYGGPAMMLVAWPISGVLSIALICTLSELASAYPVAGGMASWAWKCARAGVGGERYWGWIMCAIVLGGHVGNLILVGSQVVRVITGTMSLAFDYEATRWQMLLFFLAIVFVVGTLGSSAIGSSARYWLYAGGFGFAVWVSLCVSLLATGVRHRDYSVAPAISTHFWNVTGWKSHGYVYILGWQYCTIAAGADVCAHMSEETQNPSRTVPRAMTTSLVMTYVCGYISIIILLISVNPDDAAFLATQDFAFGRILQKAISPKGAIALSCIIVVVMCLQLQAQLQAASRFVFAMARDRALPFSDTVKMTNDKRQPFVANWLVVALWAPFGLLLLSSASVVSSVITVGTSSLSMLGYLIPVALYLLSRLDLQVEGRSAWSLRKFSRPVALVGALFCTAIIIVQIFPGKYPVDIEGVSWSPVVIIGTLVISVITWKTYGDKHYSGPIRALTKWETGMEIDLESTLQHSTARNGSGGTTSLKLAVTPCYPETVQTVQIASAQTVESDVSMGEWAQQSFTTTEAESSGHGHSREFDRTRSRGSATLDRLEEREEEREHSGSGQPRESDSISNEDVEKGL